MTSLLSIENSQLSISLRDDPVVVCRIKPEALDACCKALLRILYFSEEREAFFFSITLTKDDITMVVDEEFLRLFPPEAIAVQGQKWKAFQVTIGAAGYTGTGIVRNCTAPLAKANISIFHLSTFNTDFILVPEAKISLATKALQEHLPNISKGSPEFEELSLPEALQPPNNKLVTRPSRLSLASINRDALRESMYAIVQHIFFPDPTRTLFHITRTEEENSLILDLHLLHTFPPGALVATESWRPIQRASKNGLNETGVVSFLSKPIGDKRISILYLSTAPTSFIMVQEKKLKEAEDALQAAGLEISQA